MLRRIALSFWVARRAERFDRRLARSQPVFSAQIVVSWVRLQRCLSFSATEPLTFSTTETRLFTSVSRVRSAETRTQRARESQKKTWFQIKIDWNGTSFRIHQVTFSEPETKDCDKCDSIKWSANSWQRAEKNQGLLSKFKMTWTNFLVLIFVTVLSGRPKVFQAKV